jgi:putative membrane protein
MRRFSATLISTGISAALIAAGIWFLYDQRGPYGYGDGGRWPGLSHGMMLGAGGLGVVMILFWIIVLVALVLLVYGVASARRPASGGEKNESDALEILKQRYARGEIDQAEYQSRRYELQR